MITSLKVKSGYALNLDRLKKTVKFKPGLNILFGPNGCGKSTTAKIAAAYCGTKGGWSRWMEPTYIKKGFPDSFKRLSPGQCEAVVDWDGTPTLFADSSITDQTEFTHLFGDSDSPDGIQTIDDQIMTLMQKPSSGEIRLYQLVKYMKTLDNPPKIYEMPKVFASYNDTWCEVFKQFADYVLSLPRTGPVTLILDEPDRSLSIANQFLFWTRLIPNVIAKGHQIIVASHSVFCLGMEANCIEFVAGDVEQARLVLKEVLHK